MYFKIENICKFYFNIHGHLLNHGHVVGEVTNSKINVHNEEDHQGR